MTQRERLRVSVVHNNCIEDMTNYFKNLAGDAELTGLNLILGGYSVHLLECEGTLMNKILRTLNEYSQQASTPYQSIWVLHQTEEVSQL